MQQQVRRADQSTTVISVWFSVSVSSFLIKTLNEKQSQFDLCTQTSQTPVCAQNLQSEQEKLSFTIKFY